jgi:hypothetical protein
MEERGTHDGLQNGYTVKSELPFRSLDGSFYDNRGEKAQGHFPS